MSAERHCGLVVADALDFETRRDYTLTLVLEAPEAPPGTENRKAQVTDAPEGRERTVKACQFVNKFLLHFYVR